MGLCAIVGAFVTDLAHADESRGQSAFHARVLPVLQEFCGDCHSHATNDGRWAFDGYLRYRDLMADQESWQKASQFVAKHLMPPHGTPAPTPEQRRVITDWIDDVVFFVDPKQPDPGHVSLRRLNRAEYNNTIGDIFGIELRPADQFPVDDAGYGFDNVAEVLTISPLHVEKYLAAAREIAAEVTRLKPPERVGDELNADQLQTFAGTPELREKTFVLHSFADAVGTEIHIPIESTYQVLIRAAVGWDHQEQPTSLEVLCDGEPIEMLQPAARWQGKRGPSATAYALVTLPVGTHRIALRAKPFETTEQTKELAAINFLGIGGPFTPEPPTSSDYLRTVNQRPLAARILRLSGEELDSGSGRSSLDTGRAWFASNGYRHAPLLLKTTGEYRVRFKVGAQQVGDERVKFEVRVGEQTLGPFTVTARAQSEQWIETTAALPAGHHDWQVWFINEHKDADSGAERYFWLHEFTIEGPLEGDYGITRDEVVGVLKRAGRRLFRRPLQEAEIAKLEQVVDSTVATGQSRLAALQSGLEALLLSPKFLYHPTPRPSGSSENGSSLIDEFSLASRLSHFLWSSTPDEELLTLAEQGRLRAEFPAQVRRVLNDPKSGALTKNFAGQWLQLRNLEQVAPATELFPEFDAELAADMRRESELLFEHLLRKNRPVSEFLDADYTFVNARLAAHYGLPAREGSEFQRVSLLDSPRRGVVTHASILTLTSHPTRTSPVKRGKWILEQLFGEEVPPPPPDVPSLAEVPEDETLPLRERLEQHRADPGCAACHALLDPPGFALENYDAIGRWRSTEAGEPLQTDGRLISGEAFQDWSDLRARLVREKQDDFVRCLTEQLLTYALGRGVTYQDKLTIRKIVARHRTAALGFQDLILDVCESVPFQRMRSVAH